jgi:hypothetical protein
MPKRKPPVPIQKKLKPGDPDVTHSFMVDFGTEAYRIDMAATLTEVAPKLKAKVLPMKRTT